MTASTPDNVECPTCQGVGSSYEDHVGNCPDCGGTGRTPENVETAGCIWCKGRPLPDHDCRNFEQFAENVETSCDTCAGSGVIDANHFGDRMMIEPCVKCDGTGRAPENATPDE